MGFYSIGRKFKLHFNRKDFRHFYPSYYKHPPPPPLEAPHIIHVGFPKILKNIICYSRTTFTCMYCGPGTHHFKMLQDLREYQVKLMYSVIPIIENRNLSIRTGPHVPPLNTVSNHLVFHLNYYC